MASFSGIGGTATRVSSEWRTVSSQSQTEFGVRPYLSKSDLAESDPAIRFVFESSMPMMRVICLGMPRFAMSRGSFLDEEKMGDQTNFQEPARRKNGNRRRPEVNDCDTLLPVQYYDRVASGSTTTGEFRLFFAILEDALRCYVRAKNCRIGAKRAEFVDARKWFFARSTAGVFSFESICAFLEIDANWLRQRLESLAPEDLPMKQFHTRRRRLARLPSPSRKGRHAPSSYASANGNAVSATNGHASGNGHNIATNKHLSADEREVPS